MMPTAASSRRLREETACRRRPAHHVRGLRQIGGESVRLGEEASIDSFVGPQKGDARVTS
jgi:hypothetical protein